MKLASNWRVGVDIGGTFTDVIAVDECSRDVRVAKVHSESDDPIRSLLNGLKAIGLEWGDVSSLVHGTTMVTNAIVEGRFNSVALVTTKGFADTIEIGRQNRLHLYRLDLLQKIEPRVPRDLRFEVDERVEFTGEVRIRLTEKAIDDLHGKLDELDVDAIAVVLLHSYANPDHERVLVEELRRYTTNISLSHEVNPEAREYERTSTTVLSASVMKSVSNYLDQIDAKKPNGSQLHFFHSAGGMCSADLVRKLPLNLTYSGPAAGVAAAVKVAKQLDIRNAISFDMGGTTTDVCLINDGQAEIKSNRTLGGYPLHMPMVAVESIGAGGGSIARLDNGVLQVGPESAGASPGPACYGRGGELPTVTDANLVLGYLSANHRLADGTQLELQAAEQAISLIADEILLPVHAVALGILEVANANMVRALRRVTVDRGIDGRQCSLLAFGGAGPMHAVKLAQVFGIRKVVVPSYSSLFSAYGCISGEMSYTQRQTVRMNRDSWQVDKLMDIRSDMISRLSAPLMEYSDQDLLINEVAAIRYSGQSYSIDIPHPNLADPDELNQSFKQMHENLYGFVNDESWELESLRIRVSVPGSGTQVPATRREMHAEVAPTDVQLAWFDGTDLTPTPRYARTDLPAGHELSGPAIVEDSYSTTVLTPNSRLNVDEYGAFHIDVDIATS